MSQEKPYQRHKDKIQQYSDKLQEYTEKIPHRLPPQIKTIMLHRYDIKLVFRLLIFLGVFAFYLYDKELMWQVVTRPVYLGIGPFHVLWLVFMVIMLLHLFPVDWLTMARRKAEPQHYKPIDHFSELEMLHFVQDQNVKAWRVMLVWLTFNGIFGLLFLLNILQEADLLMLTVFFFLSDYICILFFCPFQNFIMKNRCCVNCRIYDWGHFMMFTPMLFIQNFFSWSLFFTSIVVLIHWEIVYAKHPERFWSGSNTTLQCGNCKDKTCRYKKILNEKGITPSPER